MTESSEKKSSAQKPEKEHKREETVSAEIKNFPQKKASKGAPMWIVTFADLSTLMLTFFILLLSFANTDIVKFKDMLGSVQNAFGVSKKSRGEYQPTAQGNKGDSKKSGGSGSDSAGEKRDLQSMGREIEKTIENAGQSQNISVKAGAHGVNVRIKGGYLFDPGSAQLKKESYMFLRSIARIIKKFPFNLKVEGHTDNVPISTPRFPSNWELSALRATTVLRYFTEQNGIDQRRLIATGYADNKPIAPNKEVWGRAKNRRVEFIFYK